MEATSESKTIESLLARIEILEEAAAKKEAADTLFTRGAECLGRCLVAAEVAEKGAKDSGYIYSSVCDVVANLHARLDDTHGARPADGDIPPRLNLRRGGAHIVRRDARQEPLPTGEFDDPIPI
jgi:hypothetical protein